MLKKINVCDARLGMFVHELCGKWLDHPFWKKEFVLEDQKDLDTLRGCAIKEIFIDTAKGLDVGTSDVIAVEEEIKHIENESKKEQEDVISEKKIVRLVALQDETPRAQKIHGRAQVATAALFHEARMGKALKTEETASMVDDIIQSITRNSGAILNLARLKNQDDYAYQHALAVCALMIALGRQMGVEGDELKTLGLAGLLLDIGKMKLPDELLNKPRLTDEEFELVKSHTLLGWRGLKELGEVNDTVLDVCLHHHERVDGKGYPDSLSGEALTLPARMGAVCDIYDALTSERSTGKSMAPAIAIRKMAEWQGGQLDQTVFHAFVKTVGIYPSGTLVKLKSGRFGVVTDQASKSLLTPIVKVFFSTKLNTPIMPVLVELSKVPDSIVSIEDPANLKFDWKAMAGI